MLHTLTHIRNFWRKAANYCFLRAAALTLTLLLAGCATSRDPKQPTAKEPFPIDALVLLSAPAAVDVDGNPGPDGIAVRIFGTSQAKTRALAFETGALEVLMFDGIINEQTPASAKPLHAWTNTIAELKPLAVKTALGVSYPLTLLWGKDRPTQDVITIAARYIAPNGRAIYSAPSTIPVGNPRPR